MLGVEISYTYHAIVSRKLFRTQNDSVLQISMPSFSRGFCFSGTLNVSKVINLSFGTVLRELIKYYRHYHRSKCNQCTLIHFRT